jgi:PAS domain S-box-containing protein
MENAEAIQVQPNSNTTKEPATVCRFSGCIMPDMASPGQKSGSLNIQLLVDSIPALIHTSRPDGYLDYFNKPWLEYLGVTLDKVTGWNWTAVVHPEDVEGIVAKWRACLASGEVFEYETRVRRADGEYRWMYHHKVPLRDEHGNIVKWYGSSLDIEERKTAEEQLRRKAEELQRSEFYLAEGQRLAHMGSWAFDADGFDYWSPELFRMYGFDPAGKPPSIQEYLNCVHPQDRESMANLIKGILAEASPFDATKRIVRPNGEVRYIRCVGAPVLENQRLKKYVGSAIDVTEHELLTQELRRREAYLTGAQKLSHTGSFGCKLSTGEMFWSEETFRIYGYDRSTTPAVERVLQRVHPEDRALVQEHIDQANRDGKDCHVECRLLLPDDSVKHVRIEAHTSKDESGNIEFIGAVTDVTATKQAEQDRQRSEAYLTEAQRLSHTGSWAWNVHTRAMFWSDELLRIHGFTPQETAPTWAQFLERVHPEDRAQIEQRARKEATEKDWVDSHGDFRIVLPDGTIKHLHSVAHPTKDSSGEITEIIGTSMDVTEHVLLTQELRRRQAYLTDAQRLSRTGSFGWKADTGEIVWSDETYRIFEYDRSVKPTIDSVAQRVHPEDRADFEQVINRALAGATDFEHAYRLLLPDGRVKHVHAIAHVLQDASGNREFVGAVTDITERKAAEESLRRSEAYLAEAQRLSHTGSWAWRLDTDVRYWSEECYRVLGFDPRDALPRTEELIQRIHPDDQWVFRESAKAAKNNRLDEEINYRIVHPGGAVRDIHSIGHPVFSPRGDLIEYIGTVIDVTERKRAEEELRRSEMELRQMLDLSPQQVAVFGPDGERLYANRIGLDYIGLSLEEWRQTPGDGFSFPSFFHPDDRERAVRTYSDNVRSGGSAFELELRLRKRDGTYRWFLVRFNPLRDEQGQITRWYSALTDIEDRKQAEERLGHENVALREEVDKASMFEEIVGTSPALKRVLSRISKVALSDSTVLITGETGTGKELVARAIHRRSGRASRAFVSVNCAAIPRDLIASELFGHEKGAFTGATQQRLGRFELANGGTIFLDEVGELPAETQIALLRVLQEHEFERVGGTRQIRVDVRVIAATNRDLQAAIREGSFRSDLFYRLNVFPIDIPSLRDRREDIRLLIEYFIDRYARKLSKNIREVSKKTLELLQSYPWPGNIRELQNVIERSVILCESEIFSIDEGWLPQQPSLTEPKNQIELARSLEAQEKTMIEAALKESRGRVFGPSGAAAKLGIPRSTLESKIRSLKIDKNRFKAIPGT